MPEHAGGRRVFIDYRPAETDPAGVGQFTRQVTAELEKRVVVVRLGRRTVPGGGPWWHLRTAWLVRRHPDAAYLGTGSLLVPALVGRRAVLVLHDVTPLTAPHRHPRRNRIIHRALLRLALRRAGSVVVPSQAVLADLAAYGRRTGAGAVVIPEASRFPAPDQVLAMDQRDDVVAYVGTIDPRKNVAALIQAFAMAELPGW